MNNLKREMSQVWVYINNNPGQLNFDIAKGMMMNFFHCQMLLEALSMDSYVRSEPRDSLLGGAYYWAVRVFP